MSTPSSPSSRASAPLALRPDGCPILTGAVNAGKSAPRFRLPHYVLALLTGASLLACPPARANTADNVINGSTDLTLAGSYSAGLPTTTSDVTFSNVAYSPAAFTLNSSLAIGTLNDLSTTAITIQNTSGTADTLTLSTAANSTGGTAAADLLYVATGGNLTLGGGTGNAALNLTLAVAGNFDIAGTATISSAITASGGGLSKTGTGTLVLAGNGSSSLGSSTTGGTILNLTSGTTTFGIVGTDAPSYAIAGTNTGVFLNGGNFNMVNGTITETENQGLVIAGSQTYTQTGGTFSTSGLIEFANNGGSSSIINISGGTLTDTTGRIELAIRGNSTTTLSGTGAINTPSLVMTTSQLSGGAAGSIFNLNGGTLTTGQIIPGTNGTTGTGTVFNFNGGLLTASASSTTFMQGLTSANVLAGGALINTGTFTDTIGQNLLASSTSTGGGLTKSGTGTLILSGTNTYTGANVITAGTLGVTSDASLGAIPAAAASNIQFTATGATLQDTTNNVTLSANRNITIPAGGTTTLDSSTNAFTVGGAISVTGSVTGTTLALNSGTGGAGDLTGTVTDSGTTGGLIISKTGAGAFTFGGSNTSTLAKGQIQLNAGTFNFGSATETPVLNLNGQTGTGGNVGVYVKAGTFNMAGGTLTTSATGQGLVVQGAGTVYNQTAGLLNASGGDIIEFANSGTTTQNISGGELRTAGRIELNTNGTSSLTTVSGTGLVTTPTLVMLSNQTNNNASTSTFNLNTGGTVATGSVVHGTSTGTGATTFNFNGGTLKATASSTTFLQGITAANVQAGGALINTNGFSSTIGQSLLTGTAAGTPDGGLTKNGTGILTLAASDTYTGPTTLSVGGLTLTTATALSDTALLSIANGTTFNLTAGNGTSEIVGSLILGGNAIVPGTYNTTQLSGFDNQITFGGNGETLTVASAVPEPSTWAAGLACLALLGLRLRRRLFVRG